MKFDIEFYILVLLRVSALLCEKCQPMTPTNFATDYWKCTGVSHLIIFCVSDPCSESRLTEQTESELFYSCIGTFETL